VALCFSMLALSEGFDVRNLDLHVYTYPGAYVDGESSEQYDAQLSMYSHNSPDQVVSFYQMKGLSPMLSHPDPNHVVLEKMVASHVPLKIVVSSQSDHQRLDDDDLYRNMQISTALGKHNQSELDQMRSRFNPLKSRFYADDPHSILKKCRESGSASQVKNKMSMEEQGRHLQELAMQGKMDELRAATQALSASQQGMTNMDVSNQWDKELTCLKELEKLSFPVKIEVIASRDDVLG